MVYQGSKARLRKDILPIIQSVIDNNKITTYIEPFCGGMNMIDHVRCQRRIASDSNPELIALLRYMKKEPGLPMFPDSCPKSHYDDVRIARRQNAKMKYSPAYTAGIGYFASYGGRYFDGGYGRDVTGKRELYAERLENARKQAPLFKDIEIRCMDYYEYLRLDFNGCLFYLDPPYKSTKQYATGGFDYDRLYDFCEKISGNNIVLVSEYWMPDDFECIWQKKRKVMQKSDRKTADTTVEKLFKKG